MTTRIARLTAEKAWRTTARARTPEAWCEIIEGIPDRIIRTQCACIVWWDYFGSRPKASIRWPHLDKYLVEWRVDRTSPADKKTYVEKVQNALVGLGYPERIARKRCKILGGHEVAARSAPPTRQTTDPTSSEDYAGQARREDE